jgi:hypothetical protein
MKRTLKFTYLQVLAQRPSPANEISYYLKGSIATLQSPQNHKLQIIRAVYQGREVTAQVRGIATSTELIIPEDIGDALGVDTTSAPCTTEEPWLAVIYRFIPSLPSPLPRVLPSALGEVAVADADFLRTTVELIESTGPHLCDSEWKAGYLSQVLSDCNFRWHFLTVRYGIPDFACSCENIESCAIAFVESIADSSVVIHDLDHYSPCRWRRFAISTRVPTARRRLLQCASLQHIAFEQQQCASADAALPRSIHGLPFSVPAPPLYRTRLPLPADSLLVTKWTSPVHRSCRLLSFAR